MHVQDGENKTRPTQKCIAHSRKELEELYKSSVMVSSDLMF